MRVGIAVRIDRNNKKIQKEFWEQPKNSRETPVSLSGQINTKKR